MFTFTNTELNITVTRTGPKFGFDPNFRLFGTILSLVSDWFGASLVWKIQTNSALVSKKNWIFISTGHSTRPIWIGLNPQHSAEIWTKLNCTSLLYVSLTINNIQIHPQLYPKLLKYNKRRIGTRQSLSWSGLSIYSHRVLLFIIQRWSDGQCQASAER